MGPLGTFLAEPGWDKEDIVYVTLNGSDMIEAKARSSDAVLMLNCVLIIRFDLKMDFNPVRSYSQPDAPHHVSRRLYTNTKTPKQLYDSGYHLGSTLLPKSDLSDRLPFCTTSRLSSTSK